MRLTPWDDENQRLVEAVHPPGWENPKPSGRYNLVVLGGGSAGLVSAMGAAGLGARVALVERQLAVLPSARGEIYNVGADDELSNMDVAERICALMDYPHDRIVHVADRPFNDVRYRVDDSKLRRLGWHPELSFDEALQRTHAWYDAQRHWWAPLQV